MHCLVLTESPEQVSHSDQGLQGLHCPFTEKRDYVIGSVCHVRGDWGTYELYSLPGQKEGEGHSFLSSCTPVSPKYCCTPSQGSPPPSGLGQAQLRYLVTISVPHVLEHGVQSDQSHQPPVTDNTRKRADSTTSDHYRGLHKVQIAHL